MATFASCFVSPFYTFVLFCPILNLPRCFYNKHSDSKIVLNLPSLRLNFPTDIERERGENKIEGAKYFSVFSIFRSCWKKPHIYILHVFPFIRLTKIIHLWLKYFMYMYMLSFCQDEDPLSLQNLFFVLFTSEGLLQQFKMAASILFYLSSPMESSLTCSRHSRPLLM